MNYFSPLPYFLFKMLKMQYGVYKPTRSVLGHLPSWGELFHPIEFILESQQHIMWIARAARFISSCRSDTDTIVGSLAKNVIPSEFQQSTIITQNLIFYTHIPHEVCAVSFAHLASSLTRYVEVGVDGEPVPQPVVQCAIQSICMHFLHRHRIVAASPLIAIVPIECKVVVLGV